MSTEITTLAPPAAESAPVKGLRVNGKQWKPTKTPFRKNAGLTSYAKRAEDRKALDAVKAKEKEMREAKEAERQRRVEALRKKRADKEERERYEQMAEKMHRKRVERLKRREKRNKLLKS